MMMMKTMRHLPLTEWADRLLPYGFNLLEGGVGYNIL